jgi:hypothetical protein
MTKTMGFGLGNLPQGLRNWHCGLGIWPRGLGIGPHGIGNWPHGLDNWPHGIGNPHHRYIKVSNCSIQTFSVSAVCLIQVSLETRQPFSLS